MKHLHTTDLEHIRTLEYLVDRYSMLPVQAYVVCVVSTPHQAKYLVHHLIKTKEGVWKNQSMIYENGWLTVYFISDNMSVDRVEAFRPVEWRPMSDRIPARLIDMLRAREAVGRYIYDSQITRLGRNDAKP